MQKLSDDIWRLAACESIWTAVQSDSNNNGRRVQNDHILHELLQCKSNLRNSLILACFDTPESIVPPQQTIQFFFLWSPKHTQ